MGSKRSVQIGDLTIGGGAPVRIQSMTNTDTRDASATIDQILRLEDAGCEIIRSTVFDETCVRNIRTIKDAIHIPLVADIHFDHRLAIGAVENGVDKLRINPGNIGGRANVEKLVDCVKSHHIPIRIGVNAGSLEKDLKQEYGPDSPQAMVESAMRHIRILEDCGFYDTVISLKSSTVSTTVEAYRLLSKMVDYPLHVGVTEAGTKKLGIVKSSIGIGALLLDGIGDTIRVSLTGDPVEEVYAAADILSALRLKKDTPEIISCPTCGRTRVDLSAMVEAVRSRIPQNRGYLKIAVMGCAVNGPGEASDSDIGIAYGPGKGVVFKKGVKYAAGTAEEMTELLIKEATEMILKGQ